jgi:hypothetical protein
MEYSLTGQAPPSPANGRPASERVVDESVRQLKEALDNLLDPATSSCLSAESIVELERQRNRLECYTSKAVADFDLWGEWNLDGAQTSVAWIDTRCHLAKTEARAQRRRGRSMAHLPLAARAFADGDIGAAQFDVLARLATPTNQAALARDEGILVDAARKMKFDSFCAVANYWSLLSDPDGAEEADMARRARRDAYLAKSLDGMFLGKLTLDPITGAIVHGELSRIEAELFEEDRAKAKEELGREPRAEELWRAPGQRRADAFAEMATRSATAPANGRRPEPLFTIMVGYETMHGRISQLADGIPMAPGSFLSFMDAAYFERIVFAPDARVECSVTSRFFTGATRRAIEVRDQQCTHPYCDEPADRCQIDHIKPYTEGGETTQENGRVMCGYHNRLRTQRPPPDD